MSHDGHFIVFEHLMEEIDEEGIRWELTHGNARSKGVYYGYNQSGQNVLRWQLTGGQLTIIKPVPEDRFDLVVPPRKEISASIYVSGREPLCVGKGKDNKIVVNFDDGITETVFGG